MLRFLFPWVLEDKEEEEEEVEEEGREGKNYETKKMEK